MVSVKRRRGIGDDQDRETVVIEAASSSLKAHTGHKKIRTSGGPSRQTRPRSPFLSDQTADILSPAAVPVDHDVFPSTQYDIDRDAGFVHLNNPEKDDAMATQRIEQRQKKLLANGGQIGDNHAADNGIIECVTMKNFMCNDNTVVALGPLINFIIGENGAGKSTVLTALQLCLGGKASTTNRGGSLKSFIKEGCESALLIIQIKNQGADAYQPELFGQSIIVERHFSKMGSSSFKLKSIAGRVISTKKSDVEEIQEYFQMQIENPMSVLTQDAARQFLNSSTPTDKYKFFVKGVQLEQLDNDYRLVAETADTMEQKLRLTREQLQHLKKKADAAKEKNEIVSQHKGMRAKITLYGKQCAWAQVEAEEQKLQERRQAVIESDESILRAEADADTKAEVYQRADERAQRADEVKRELLDKLPPLQDLVSEAKCNWEAANQEVLRTLSEHRQIKGHLQSATTKAKAIQEDIDEEQQRLDNANDGSHSRRVAELEAAQARQRVSSAEFAKNVSDLSQSNECSLSAQANLEKLNGPLQAKRKEILNCETRLASLRRDTIHAMAGFDAKMPRLLSMIHEDGTFREKPVGPIGLHIKLLKPIWSNVLEKSIGNLLSGFVVTSKPDQQRLSGMMRQFGLENCPILIGNHNLINTDGHEPDEQYDTVLRVLEIDNLLIKRQLIINQGIEQTVLIEKRDDAMRVMYANSRPRNVKQCFCLHDSRRGWGLRLGYMAGSSGNPSSGPIQPFLGKPRMKTDAESQISYHTESLAQLQQELSELQEQQRQLSQTAAKHSQTTIRQKKLETELRVKVQKADSEIETLQHELDHAMVQDGRLGGLREYLREAHDEVVLHSGSYGEASLAKKRQLEVAAELRRMLDAATVHIRDHEAQVKKGEEKLKRLQQAREIHLREKNAAIEEVELARAAKETAESKRDRQVEHVADFITQASLVSSRVPIPHNETIESLEMKMDKAIKAVSTYNKKLGGTDEEITAQAKRTKEDWEAAQRQVVGLEALLDAIKKSIFKRQEQWRRLQQHISAQSRINFTYLLSERGFRGKLRIDHQSRLLDLEVEPDETRKSGRGRATKTLSGGEKSFSSICLLLALWEAMGAPLRCLDEFDVFMDNVNRDVSTKMIVGAARRSVSKQFILITPNAIGGEAQFDKDVKITRLFDPRKDAQRIAARLAAQGR